MADYGSQAEEGTLAYRISGQRLNSIPDWKSDSIAPLPPANKFLNEIVPYMCLEGRKPDPFATAFFLRMLYSCLVDADFLDTERFCSPDRYNSRPAWPSIHVLKGRLEDYLRNKKFLTDVQITPEDITQYADSSCGTSKRVEAIRLARQFMHQKCISASNERAGLFSLTMPTGGGKTLSSLSFALRHADKHGLQRVIYVIPYTSIIEQNAEVFRQALGLEAVLEHHSNYSYPEDEDSDGTIRPDYMLSTENWDASVIVTTSVQFFESLFDNRPSRCRKLHNIANSVIVLDEVQMLPVPYLKPCLKTLKLLTEKYGCTVVLCTATQPALLHSSSLEEGFEADDVLEIIPRELHSTLFNIFKRATVEQRGIMDDKDLANTIMAENQVLCIVNSRNHAGELFALLGDNDSCYHLSARMTPVHRTRVLAEIRQRLSDNVPCRVVSTSLT